MFIAGRHKKRYSKQNQLFKKLTLPSLSEGECQIEEVHGLVNNFRREVMYHLLGIVTFGMGYLLFHWLPNIHKKLRYFQCDVPEATHFWVRNWDASHCLVPKQIFKNVRLYAQQQNKKRFSIEKVEGFESRHQKYAYINLQNAFCCIEANSTELVTQSDIHYGLSERSGLVKALAIQYGSGAIELEVPSYLELFVLEVVHPFFIFQMYSVVLWLVEDYVAFSIIILVITLASAVSSLLLVRKNLFKVREMALIEVRLQVLRDGETKTLGNSELVPGDIIVLENGLRVPCDCVLLRGQQNII